MSDEQKKPTAYDLIGGEEGIRRLVKRFYEIMDTLPEAYAVRKLHGADLSGSEQKLFKYLTGYLGGPPLYENEYGHPRLRMRHLPFAIATAERDQWMLCMRQAMSETVALPALRTALEKAFGDLADHMRNRPD